MDQSLIDRFEQADNLLEPMTFNAAEIEKFTKRNNCTCGGTLRPVVHMRSLNTYRALCIRCNEYTYMHNNMSKAAAERIDSETAAASLEIRMEEKSNQPRRDTNTIMHELGY